MRYGAVHQGDIGETDFLARATKKGFRVSQPYGKDSPYDSILDNGLTRFLMQVKATSALHHKNVYFARAGKHFGRRGRKTVPYADSEVDFVAAYVVPEDTWYIIPIEALGGVTSLYLYSRNHKKKGPWDAYRENWDLLRQHQTPAVAELMRKVRAEAAEKAARREEKIARTKKRREERKEEQKEEQKEEREKTAQQLSS